MNLHSKAFPAGSVALGGNLAPPAGGSTAYSNYAVIVREDAPASPAPVQVFSYGLNGNTNEGGGYFQITNSGTAAVALAPRCDLALTTAANNSIQVWFNNTNWNNASPASGTWTSWGTGAATGLGTGQWTALELPGASTLTIQPGQTVGFLVRATVANSVAYTNPGPSSSLALTAPLAGCTLRFQNGVSAGSGLPSSLFGTPRGLNIRLYSVP